MSTISSINPVTGQPATSTTSTTSTTASTAGLSSQDFMNLMITQLQNQDTLNPTDSNALLQQIAQISTLQSNTQLQTSLTGLTLQQSIGAGGNLIGKAVQGIDVNNNQVAGTVTGVQIQNQQVYLALDNGGVLPMQNITTISQPAPATTTPTTSSTTTTPTSQASVAQTIINALQGLTGG